MITKKQPDNSTQGVGPDESTNNQTNMSSDRFENDVSWSIDQSSRETTCSDFSYPVSYENIDSGPGDGGNDSRMI